MCQGALDVPRVLGVPRSRSARALLHGNSNLPCTRHWLCVGDICSQQAWPGCSAQWYLILHGLNSARPTKPCIPSGLAHAQTFAKMLSVSLVSAFVCKFAYCMGNAASCFLFPSCYPVQNVPPDLNWGCMYAAQRQTPSRTVYRCGYPPKVLPGHLQKGVS